MSLHNERSFCLVMTLAFSTCFSSFPEYEFKVYPVKKCPMNKEAWDISSARLSCNRTHGYHCVPNKVLTALIEFCYPRGENILFQEGNCLELAGTGILNHVRCTNTFSSGCPDSFYYGNEIFKYPKCLEINTTLGCFDSDTQCFNLRLMKTNRAERNASTELSGNLTQNNSEEFPILMKNNTAERNGTIELYGNLTQNNSGEFNALKKNNSAERNGTIELSGNLAQNNSREFNVQVGKNTVEQNNTTEQREILTKTITESFPVLVIVPSILLSIIVLVLIVVILKEKGCTVKFPNLGRNEVINYINSGHRNDTHSYDRPSHEECNSIHYDDEGTHLLSNNDSNQSDSQSDSQIPYIDQESPYTECSFEDQVMSKPEETNISMPTVQSEVPPELPPRLYEPYLNTSLSSSSMQQNVKCSQVYNDYRSDPMTQRTQSPNTVPKVIYNNPGSSMILESEDQVMSKPEETNISMPTVQSEVPPELPPRLYEPYSNTSLSSSSMQQNVKCSQVYNDYRSDPMTQRTQSPNTVPKIINNCPGSSMTLESEDQVMSKPEETNISMPTVQSEVPPELPSRRPHETYLNTSISSSTMQQNIKCSHVYYDYRSNPMAQQTQSPNTVPKVLNNEPGSSTTLDSESTDGTVMPNIVSEGYYETYDGVLDTSADNNLQQNCSVQMDIYNPTWSSVDFSKQSSHHLQQIDIPRVPCFSLFKFETWMLALNPWCSFRSNSK